MARSTYIYIVENEEGSPVAAFTVKHECVSWITRNRMDILYEGGFVGRWKDGNGGFVDIIPIKDFIGAPQ